jgi:Stage II sporulation protein E (SpoIIE)/GAF domain
VSRVVEHQRLIALHRLELLDTPPEERFDRIVRITQRLFDVPIVSVKLIDDSRAFTKSAVGMSTGYLPRGATICNYTLESAAPLVVPNLSLDSRFSSSPVVLGEPHLRFYAGQPLAAPGGQIVGSLCIIDTKPREFTPADLALLRDLADWVEHELASEDELVHAREIQRRLMPNRAPDIAGFDIAGRCMPARELGGDFFDWQFRDDRLQIVIADVMGKGVGAALIAASARSVIRGASRFNDLQESVRRTAMTMEEDLHETSTFVTMFICRLEPLTGDLEYIDAGHGLALIITPDGLIRQLAGDGLPLGAITEDRWQSSHDRLAPGDTLIIVSDGILDYFPDPRTAAKAAADLCRSSRDAWEMVDQITTVGVGYPPSDDITAVVVRRPEA